MIVARQIRARIGDDEQTDAKDQTGKEKAKTVEHQGEVQTKLRDPVNPRGQHLSGQYGGQMGEQADKGHEGNHEGDPGAGLAPCGIHQSG